MIGALLIGVPVFFFYLIARRGRHDLASSVVRKSSNVGLGCAVYLGLFLVYVVVLNPMVEEQSRGFWSVVILVGGAVAVIAWASARTRSQTALTMQELEIRRAN
jgi:hypothetical protein